jgi:hypothetical protein
MRKLWIIIMLLGCTVMLMAQGNSRKSTLAVFHIDSKGMEVGPEQMGNITRLEVDKLGLYEVMDIYDVEYLVQQKDLKLEDCYGKLCVLELGKKIDVDKVLTGSVERLQDVIVINFRLVNIRSGIVEKAKVEEYLNIEQQVSLMVNMTLKRMFELDSDQEIYEKLTKEFDYESTLNTPEVSRLNLSGPRMGVTLFTGDRAKVFEADKDEGGFENYPLMFQFGYQFEIKYLNQGNFQALFEFVPIITGLDQGEFRPSISILNGLRNNRNGLEFAFGPIFLVTKEARGYYDENNVWHVESDWWESGQQDPNPYPTDTRFDSRGQPKFDTGFVFAIGKTFKSGKLNIPVNAFFIPDRDGSSYGVSVGFNASRK